MPVAMNIKIIHIFLLWLVLNPSVKGNRISVDPFPLMEQLPSNTVTRIFQDYEGFLWLGTPDGLCRYDAYRLLVFRSDINNPDLLTNNEITCLAEDKNNHLFIGTKNGINILNKKTYNITAFGDSILQNKEIKSIKITEDGYIWVGTTGTVYCFNADFSFRKQYDHQLPVTSVNSFYEDSEGGLWVMMWREGLFKYDSENDRFIRMPRIGNKNNPFQIHKDSRGQYWLCTWDDGVFLIDSGNGSEITYRPFPIFNKEKKSSEKIFFGIAEDRADGYIWLMSNSGLYVFEYDENDRLSEVDVSGVFDKYNNIYSEIITDKDGNLWIASFYEGALYVNFNKPCIKNYRMSSIRSQTGFAPNVTSLYKDKENEIWFHQNRWGLAFYNMEKDEVRFYQDIPVLKGENGFDVVNYISGFHSMPDVVWVASDINECIYEIKKSNGKISSYTPIDLSEYAPEPGKALFFYEDRKNNIWIATERYLFIKPCHEEAIKVVRQIPALITGITEDTRGSIWVSTKNAGIYVFPLFSVYTADNNPTLHLTKETGELVSDHIETICADINGKVWMGTKEGHIIAYDIIEKTSNDITKSLILFSEGIISLIADYHGHIWILTDKRVIEYNPHTGASRNYTTKDGVQVSSFSAKSVYKDNGTGNLYLGGNQGISVFSPSEALTDKTKDIKSIITDIKINNQSVFHLNDKNRFDITTQMLTLDSGDKNIEIDFSSLNYSSPSTIFYAYKMEGVDDGWIYSGNRQYAFYNKLNKGSRKFLIKATDENNLWSSVIMAMNVYKRPAVYETWWAYVLYSAMLILIICIAYLRIKNRIKLRNELRIAQIEKDKTEELTQMKLRYFTNITHDFLTPLTILSCLVDDAEITNKTETNLFGSMRSNINKLIRLLQQILDFRKIENGKMELKLLQGDIVKFIKDICYTDFIPLIKKKNINFRFISASEHISAYFDPDKINKIIYNLLSNAFKYTNDGGTIEVELEEETTEKHRWLKINVKDSGIGIEPQHIPHIFTRFYHNKTNIAKETNGIGLSLTKELTDLHKGSISVRSDLNKGTVFKIELPIDKDSYTETDINDIQYLIEDQKNTKIQPVSGKPESTDITKNEVKENKDRITLLIAEDNEDLLLLMRNLLSHHYQVLTALNGKDALSVIRNHEVDIVISDVMMPEMDGLELCGIIKNNIETSHIPVIMLTAKNSVDDRVECYNAGADGYIAKPFDLKVLNARVKNFISNKKSRQKEFQEDKDLNLSKLEYHTLDEKLLKQAIQIIEDNLSDIELDVITFAEALHMSKSSLYRKLKTITGLSPVEFIRNIRLKEASKRLKDKSISISEVAYSVGFSDPKYFATCFKNEFNISPSEFQRKT